MLFLCSVGVMAQDVIVKKDGSTIVCRVEKVSETDVTYKLWSDLKGSSYVMDKSLVSAINYENGKKETFGETQSLYLPNNQNDGVQAVNDKALLKMDWAANKPYKKVKRLKTWGWIVGGALMAGGGGLLAYGLIEDGIEEPTSVAGLVSAGLGVCLTTTCLLVAHKQKKRLDALQTSALYRYDIPLSNGSSLSMGADLLNDRIMDKRTVGLGLRYNF